MLRRAGSAFGGALAFAATLSMAACGRDGVPADGARATPEAREATAASLTTLATRPVVTVYKSPT